MASGIAAALERVADALTGQSFEVDGTTYDLAVAVDPADLQAPAVWVDLDHLSPDLMSGDGTAYVALYLIAPNTDPVSALDVLDGILGVVLEFVDLEDDLTPQTVILPSNAGEGLPALRALTLTPYYRTDTP